MIHPEISELQKTVSSVVDSLQRTTIHLINNNRIFTDTAIYDDVDDGDSENVYGEFSNVTL